MKKLLLMTALTALLLHHAAAQDWKESRHSFSFSVGAFPLTKDMEAFEWKSGCGPHWWGIHDSYSDKVSTYAGSMKTGGSFSFTYNNRLNRWFRWDVSATYTGFYQNLYSNHSSVKQKNISRHYLYFMMGFSAVWCSTRTVELYSGFEVGPGFVATRDTYYDENKGFMGGHFNMIGIKVGRSGYYGMAEIGCGMKGLISAGFGIRLNNKKRK